MEVQNSINFTVCARGKNRKTVFNLPRDALLQVVLKRNPLDGKARSRLQRRFDRALAMSLTSQGLKDLSIGFVLDPCLISWHLQDVYINVNVGFVF